MPEGDKQCHPGASRGSQQRAGRSLTGASAAGARSVERGLGPAQRLEGPAAQSFEHAHCACMVHLGTQALTGAAPPGPHKSPLNGDLDLSQGLTLGACDLAVLGLGHKGSLAQSLDDADFGQGLRLPLKTRA